MIGYKNCKTLATCRGDLRVCPLPNMPKYHNDKINHFPKISMNLNNKKTLIKMLFYANEFKIKYNDRL